MDWGWFTDQERFITDLIKDDKVKEEYAKAYKNICYNLRRNYDLLNTMTNFPAQIVVDEIGVLSVRIREIERISQKIFIDTHKISKPLEETLENLRKQRTRSLFDLETLVGGKNLKHQKAGRMTYRDKMNRSKKLQQIQRIHDTIEGSTPVQADNGGSTDPFGLGSPVGLVDEAGGDVRLPAEMDSGQE